MILAIVKGQLEECVSIDEQELLSEREFQHRVIFCILAANDAHDSSELHPVASPIQESVLIQISGYVPIPISWFISG